MDFNFEILIGYHFPCTDGYFSAFMVYLLLRTIDEDNLIPILDCYFKNYENFKKEIELLKTKCLKNTNAFENIDFHEFLSVNLPRTRFVPLKYSEKEEENEINKLKYSLRKENVEKKNYLIIIDYSFKDESSLEALKQTFTRIYILDHHETFLISRNLPVKSSKFNIDEKIYAEVDLNECGATLIQKIFSFIFDEKFTKFMFLNQDIKAYDTKINKNLESEYITSVCFEIMSRGYNFSTGFLPFANVLKYQRETLIQIGSDIYKNQEKMAKEALEFAKVMKIKSSQGNFQCFYLDSIPSSIINIAGTLLAEKSLEEFGNDIGIILQKPYNSMRKVQLRGTGKIHLGKIALEYNGGGHPGAASFFCNTKTITSWKKLSNNKKSNY